MQATTASPSYVHTGLGDGATRYYKVAAYDGAGNQSAGQATYAVATTTIPNRIPAFTVAPTTATIASSGGTIQFTATDADGDTLTYTLPVTRTGITINPSTGLVTVASSAAGTTGSITVRATDPAGLYAEASCAVTVQSSGSTFGRVMYEDWSSGTIGAYWRTDSGHNRGEIRTVGYDGSPPPAGQTYFYSSNANGTVADSNPARYETVRMGQHNYTDELMIRFYIRIDADHAKTGGSWAKLFRHWYYQGFPEYLDLIFGLYTSAGLTNGAWANGGFTTYYGNTGGDTTGTSGAWHRVEMYWRRSTGALRIWHDGVLKTDISTANPGPATGYNPSQVSRFFETGDLYLRSNYEDAHDASNHIYYGPIEVYTDQGTGGTGSMSAGTAGV